MGAAAGKEETEESRVSSGRPVEMSCEACTVRFTVLKRKKSCSECMRQYCGHCAPKIKSGSGRRCDRCQFLVSGSFTRVDLQNYKAKEIRHFLTKRRVPVDNCREKSDLIDTLLRYSNNAAYRLEQQESEIRKQQLQEQARQNLTSPPSSQQYPQPPSYSTVRDDARDASEPIIIENTDNSSGRDNTNNTQSNQTNSERLRFNFNHYDNEERLSASNDSSPDRAVPSNTTDNPSRSNPSTEQPSTTLEQPSISQVPSTNQQPNETVSDTHQSHSEQTRSASTPDAKSPDTGRHKFTLQDVKSEAEIEELSGRQLKELLERNFVDYRGCVEKHELVTRVTRLWRTHRIAQQRVEEIEQGGEEVSSSGGHHEVCKICMDALVNCVLLDCGHMLTCTDCGKQLAECPVCRQFVVRVVHVFKA